MRDANDCCIHTTSTSSTILNTISSTPRVDYITRRHDLTCRQRCTEPARSRLVPIAASANRLQPTSLLAYCAQLTYRYTQRSAAPEHSASDDVV